MSCPIRFKTMRIGLITPSSETTLDGNHITARRWARIFRGLSHRVTNRKEYAGQASELLIALHARKSYESVRRFRERYREAPLVLALTGTDLYRDLPKSGKARRSLHLATVLVVLQRKALEELPKHLHQKTRVIYQSAEPVAQESDPPSSYFQVCVIGHLRPEKDPFRAARAVRRLSASSRVKVLHIGRAVRPHMERRAQEESKRNPRYRWLGELSHGKTRQLLANSHLLLLTSRMEGSSNVLSEALASSTPVVATRIPGLVGTLGEDYPGYFPVGDTRALAALLQKAEEDSAFYESLQKYGAEVAPLVDPRRELTAWKELLEEL